MVVRLSLIDWCGLVVLAIALVLPARPLQVERPIVDGSIDDVGRVQFDPALVRGVARAQAEHWETPADPMVLESVTDGLRRIERHDIAFKLAGARAAAGGNDAWKAMVEVSTTHADRVELKYAHEWSEKALAACDDSAACPDRAAPSAVAGPRETPGNVLLLDEPTNDLDVETLRALEGGLSSFPGCVVIISHDRWFLDRLATHILAFEGDSHVEWFEGNYRDYEADRRRRLGEDADRPHRLKYKPIARA